MNTKLFQAIVSLPALLLSPGFALAATPSSETLMVDRAERLIESFDEKQTEKALRPFSDDRKDWHFIPRDRDGLSFKEMSEEQESLVYELLGAGLSEQGVKTVDDVRSLEVVLQVLEGRSRDSIRDPDRYHLWIYGTPGSAIWAWRFEGHHISINATIVSGEGVSMTPTFLGANPAEVPSGDRAGFRALPQEEDLAFAFMETLDETQRTKAVFETEAPRDIFTSADRKIKPLPIEGISFATLNPDQRRLITEMVDVYLLRNRPDIREAALAEIEEAGWQSVSFGWAGPVDRDRGNYYFIQGPGFLIEYDNTQNNNNHIHSVWREFDGDFGEDLIGSHRQAHSH